MSSLTLRNISKDFGSVHAVHNVNLEVASGEFFSILGPSGCGKTTLLRLIAGFEEPTRGTLMLDGTDVTRLRPRERQIGMVFQNYALFPHMTVFENVAFGLETKRLPRDQIRRRVTDMLDAVHLAQKAGLPVVQLSGGEQQRVAVARALVVEPKVLLFDEPLSNLDVSLRVQTREEIRSLQQRFRITALYVTHDQEEAMTLSDRIAVMRQGRIEQVGSPAEVYRAPRSAFVAEFLGSANLLTGTAQPDGRSVAVGNAVFPLSERATPGSTFIVAVKPEAVVISQDIHEPELTGIVRQREYMGFITRFLVEWSGMTLRATMLSSLETERFNPGDRVGIRFDVSRCNVFRQE